MRVIGLNKNSHVIVDDDDYDRVMEHKWSLVTKSGCEYSHRCVDSRRSRQVHQTLHYFILGIKPKKGLEVHHRDGDGLNNTKANLVVLNRIQHRHTRGKPSNNTSGYKGVGKRGDRWVAKFKARGLWVHVGYFNTAREAAIAHDKFSVKMFGKDARVNFESIDELDKRIGDLEFARFCERTKYDPTWT